MGKGFILVVGVSEIDFHNPKINEYISSLHNHKLKLFKLDGKEIVGVQVEDSENRESMMKCVEEAHNIFYELAFSGLQIHVPKVYTIPVKK